MMKKQYETPELEIVILEQSDIITVSVLNGANTAVKGEHGGVEHTFGNWS